MPRATGGSSRATGSRNRWANGFQAHTIEDGYGTGNTFRANVVDGEIPGFGIGLYPANDNVVTCDNVAPGAAQGLVGEGKRPIACV